MLIRNIKNQLVEHEKVKNIELKYLPHDFVADACITLEWCKKNPTTTIVAIDNDNIIGHCSIFPISDRFYNALIKGGEKDVELSPDDILINIEPIKYLYLSVICVEKEYRKNTTIDLINRYIEIYDEMTNDDTVIIVEYCTEDGHRFVKKYGFRDTEVEDKKIQKWNEFKLNIKSKCNNA